MHKHKLIKWCKHHRYGYKCIICGKFKQDWGDEFE